MPEIKWAWTELGVDRTRYLPCQLRRGHSKLYKLSRAKKGCTYFTNLLLDSLVIIDLSYCRVLRPFAKPLASIPSCLSVNRPPKVRFYLRLLKQDF